MSQEQGAPDLLHRRAFHAMGCEMLALVSAPGEEPAILARVPQWFEEWEQALSRFRLDSELSQLNRQPDRYVPVGETLWEVYQAALWAEGFTQGLVTPAVGQAVLEAGYDRSFDLMGKHQAGKMLGYLSTTWGAVKPGELAAWEPVKTAASLLHN